MDKIDKLWEIADRYNTSKPVSGNWDTETEHELNAISKELGISKQEAKDLMIKELGFDDSMFNGINCSLDKVEPVTPPRSIPHELPPHNNEPVKEEKKTDEDGKSFKDYLDEARKNASSSCQIKSARKPYKEWDIQDFIDYGLRMDLNEARLLDHVEDRVKRGICTPEQAAMVRNYFYAGNTDTRDHIDDYYRKLNHIKYKDFTPEQMDKEVEKYKNISTSFIRSARYIATDPESGEVLGSADTYEEAINEWGEDVTITDSEAAEGQGEENMGLFSSIDELNNKHITEGMRVTWGEKGKGKVIMWDGNDVLVQGITGTGDDYFIVGYDFELTGNAKEPHLTWKYGDYDAGNDKEQAIQYFENRRRDISNSRKLVKSSFDDEEDTIDIETLAEELVKEGYNSDIVEKVKDEWLNEYSISELTDDEDMDFRRDVERLALNSSKKPNGDKAFLSNIVSSVSTNNMTEGQAIKRIALRNNCNEGFARNILSEALKDETLIQSGVMEIADDINKEFDIDGNIDSWLKAYMKDEGKSNTVGGEILRAFAKIRYRYYNDGDMIGRGYGKETVNPAARYLYAKVLDSSTADIEEMLNGESDINRSPETYEEWLEGYEGSLENYLRNNEELFHTPNKEDMLDYRTEEDKDSSVTECYIEDSGGNTYWFENDGSGDWKCYQIDFGTDAEFEVGDVIDDSQLEQYVDFSDEDDYVDFDLDGLSYSAERTDGGWEITNVELDGGLANEGDYWSVDDLMREDVFDSNGNSLSENDLY